MTDQAAIHLGRDLLWTVLTLSLPLLLVCFVVGLIVGVVQVATSLQDSAVASLPKLMAFFAALVVLMPWMLRVASDYAVSVLSDVQRYVR